MSRSSQTSFKGTIKSLNKFIGWKSTLAHLDEQPLENGFPYLIDELLENPHSRASKRIVKYLGNNEQLPYALSLYLMTPKTESAFNVLGKLLVEIQQPDLFFLELFNQAVINSSYQQLRDLFLIKIDQRLIISALQVLVDSISELLPKIPLIYTNLLYVLVRESKSESLGTILNVLANYFYANEAEMLVEPLIQQFIPDIIPILLEKVYTYPDKEKNFLRLIQFLKLLDDFPLTEILESLSYTKENINLTIAFLDEIYQYLSIHNEKISLVFQQFEKSSYSQRTVLIDFLKRFGKVISSSLDSSLEKSLAPDIFKAYLQLYEYVNSNGSTNKLIKLLTTPNGRLAAHELRTYGPKVFPLLLPFITQDLSLDASTFVARIFLNNQIEAIDTLVPLIETSPSVRQNPIIMVILQHLTRDSAIYLTKKILLSFKDSPNYYWQFLASYAQDVCQIVIYRIYQENKNESKGSLSNYVTFFMLGKEISCKILVHELENQNGLNTVIWELIKLYENEPWYLANVLPLLAYGQYESTIQTLIRPKILANLKLLDILFSTLDSSPPAVSSGLVRFLLTIGNPVVEPLFQRVLKSNNENFIAHALIVLIKLESYKEIVNILSSPKGQSILPLIIGDIDKILPYILQSSARSQSTFVNPSLYNILLLLPEEIVFDSFIKLLNKEKAIQDSLTIQQYLLVNYQYILQKLPEIYLTSSTTIQSWLLSFIKLKPEETLKYFKTISNSQKHFLQVPAIHTLITSIIYELLENIEVESKQFQKQTINLIESLPVLGPESLPKFTKLYRMIDPSNILVLNTLIQNLEYIGNDSLTLLIEILATGSDSLLDQLFLAFNQLIPASIHSLLNVIIGTEKVSKKLIKRCEDILLRMDNPDIIQLGLQTFGTYSLDYQNSNLFLFLEKKIKNELIDDPSSIALRTVITELGSDNAFVRASAHEICVLMGEKSIPILINVLENYTQSTESLHIINILQTLSSFSQSSILPLINLLYHSNGYVKRMAIRGLVIIGEKSVDPLIDLLLNDQKLSKDLVFSIFNQMGETAVKGITARLKTVSNRESLILLIDALNETHSLHASNTLVDLLNYPDPEVQKHAEIALHGLLINQESFGQFLSQISESLRAKAESKNQLVQCTGCGEYILPNSNYCNHCLTPQVPFKCAICTGSDVTKLLAECPHCKHLFHQDHLLKWLETKDICPVCREKLNANLIRILWICPNESCKRRNDLALPYCSKCKHKNPFASKKR